MERTASANSTFAPKVNTTSEKYSASYNYCMQVELGGYQTFNLILGVFIFIVNIFVFFFACCSRLLRRNASNVTLIGLSLNDMLAGLSLVLYTVQDFIFDRYGCGKNILDSMYVWDYFSYYLKKTTLFCGVGHLLLLAGERMIGLFLPLHYRSMVVTKRTLTAVLIVWAISIGITIAELCNSGSVSYMKIETCVTVVLFGFVPTILLCLQYIAMLSVIYKFQQKHNMEIKKVFVKHKPYFIYLSMYLSFLFLSFPYFGMRFLTLFQTATVTRESRKVLTTMHFLPSLLNPIQYAMFKDDFHQAFQRWNRKRRSTISGSESWFLMTRFNESMKRKISIRMQLVLKNNDNVFV